MDKSTRAPPSPPAPLTRGRQLLMRPQRVNKVNTHSPHTQLTHHALHGRLALHHLHTSAAEYRQSNNLVAEWSSADVIRTLRTERQRERQRRFPDAGSALVSELPPETIPLCLTHHLLAAVHPAVILSVNPRIV